MFYVADLIGPFLAFEKLYEKKRNALNVIDQTIYWRDLVVRTGEGQFGESQDNYTSPYSEPVEERLIDHIELLFKLANEDHRANYCDKTLGGSYQLKPGKENFITRLTMPEFSLYTPAPFKTEEYSTLYQIIEGLAQKLEPNVHILLSSFAVRDKEGKILNMLMYVEGGQPPKIHTFAKNTASLTDFDYGNQSELFTQQELSWCTFDADTSTSESGTNVFTESFLEIETKGKACCTLFIDVCVDHCFGHSRQQLERCIDSPVDSKIIPQQVEQCISSNHVEIESQNVVSTKVIQADPLSSPLAHHNQRSGQKQLDNDVIRKMMPSQYDLMYFIDKEWGYEFYNPAFGSDFMIEVLDERPAGNYVPFYQQQVSLHNERVTANQIAASRGITLSEEQKLAWILTRGNATSQCLSQHIKKLESSLFKLCESSRWDNLFNSEQARKKRLARQMIRESLVLIKEAIQEKGNAAIFSVEPWKKDLLFKLSKLGFTKESESLKQKLVNIIELTITLLEYDLNVRLEKPALGHADNFGSFSYL